MPRIARIVGIGYPHHIIQRGNNRQNIFFDQEDRRLYLKWLKKYSLECGCTVHAYCLMNNHVHLLFVPQHNYSLAKTMQKLSLRFTQHINKKYKRTGRLWECRFYSALVDKELYFWSIGRYIERNPVRAKITKKAWEYKWSSALDHTKERTKPLIRLKDRRDSNNWKEYLQENDPEMTEDIRIKTNRGLVVGTEKFIKKLERRLNCSLRCLSQGRPRKNS